MADTTELRVLREFYQATDGPQWTTRTNWLVGTTLAEAASWHGVQVGGGDVVALRFYGNGLRGNLPASLVELRGLQSLYLPGNALAGDLPSGLERLRGLRELQLWQNRLTGAVPLALAQLDSLRVLGLQSNRLTGGIPPQLGRLARLEDLNLNDNQLTGGIPPELAQLARLRNLDLYANRLSGAIPPQLGQLARLESLTLAVNQLVGPLPPELGQLARLTNLQLWQNNFQDSIPAAWGQLARLERLNVGQAGLRGRLPAALGQLTALQGLSVSSNNLTGPLPAGLAQLPQLNTLWAERNAFSGELPAQWTAAMRDLRLAFNRFTGNLPPGLARATALTYLRLGDNQLSGVIPPAWGRLVALQECWLGQNRLTGPLPDSLTYLRQLTMFNAARNQLSGRLPDSLGRWRRLVTLQLDHNAFTGPVPAALAQCARLSTLELHDNRFSGMLAPLAALPALRSANLGQNRFGGALPAAVLRRPSLQTLVLANNELTGVEDLAGATGLAVGVNVAGNYLDFASVERLYQGPGQPRMAAVDARGQRPPTRVDTSRYLNGGALPLRVPNSTAAHAYRYQWQRLVAGQWVNLPGDTLATKDWAAATAAEQGTYRRAERNRWFIDGATAPTELYSVMVYADLLPYAPLARNRPVDTNQHAELATPPAAPDATASAPADVNFVRTRTPRVALTNAEQVDQAGVDDVAVSTTYLDGLGRPVQTVQHRASPQRRDLVQPQAYDGLGREPRQFLPYAADPTNLAQGYHHRALANQQAFYLPGPQGPPAATDPTRGVARTGAAYAETLFEPSPLNRVLAQGAAGEGWQLTSGHAQQRLERPNTAQDAVPRFAPGYDATDRDPGYRGYYPAGELWGVQTTDEQNGPGGEGYATIEWKDKQGQTVLKQVESARTGSAATTRSWLRTAYVYDDFNRLRYVLQPEATKRVLAGGDRPAALPAAAAPFLFHYRYDARGRQIAKQVPGTDGETVVVFDQLDRPVLSQDAAQRGRREWSWTKYDALGRVVLAGLVTYVDASGPAALQTLADAQTDAAQQYEQRTADGGTFPHGYTTTQAFPRLGQGGFGPGQVLSVTYYDDYNFNNDAQGTPDATYDTRSDAQFAAGTAPVADVLRTANLTTRTKTRVLGVDANDATQAAWLTTTTFYDERARPVQVQTTNARQGLDLLTTQLDFTGKVVQSVAVHEGPNHAPVTVAEFFTYDHTGRLLTTRQQLPGEAQPTLLANVHYNELGQATQKALGTGRLAQQVEYSYNIRGWLTGLNNPYAPKATDLFSLSLHYERGFTPTYEQYNGNLTGQTWRGRDGVQRAYGYVYDPLNRLLQGDFVARTGGAGNPSGAWTAEEDRYRLAFASYDDNGNLRTLRRRGLLQNATHATTPRFGPVDELTYAYQGNRLQAVDDAVSTNQLPRPSGYQGAPASLAGDFQEGGTHLSQEYLYDANGNLTQDRNKGITGIAYNHLNLPERISFSATDYLEFRYTAAGQKVAKLVYQTGKPVQRTDYLGPYQYEQDSLRFFPHAEGRVLRFANTTSGQVRYEREFTFKDHLGNLRLAYRLGQVRTLTATLEPDAATRARESQQFDSLSVSPPVAVATGLARTGAYAAKLNAGGAAPQPLGPLTQFAVQKGDTVRVSAPGLYPQATSSHSFAFSLASFVAALLQPAPAGTPPRADGSRRGGLPLLQVGLSSAALLGLAQVPGGVPKGYLRVLSFNQDSVLVDQRTMQLSAAALGQYETLQTGPLVVQQNGYVSVYVGNESATDVYFDDLAIEHRQGLQVQENQYDPTGLELAGLQGTTPGLKPLNQYKFNGKEFQADLGLNWNHQDWRFFDPQLNRWHVVDPELENGQESWTPYSFGFDNAVRYADADGRAPGDGVWGFVTAAVDFTNGFANGMVANNTTLPNGASLVPRVAPSNSFEAAGQTGADLVSLVQGGAEFLAGGLAATGGTVGGIVTAPTGVGAVAGAGLTMAGIGVAGHGLNTVNNAMRNLLNNDHNGRYNASSTSDGPRSTKHTDNRHIDRNKYPDKSKYLKPNQRDKLIERTMKSPDQVTQQSRGRTRYDKTYGRKIGTRGETSHRVVVDERKNKTVTDFPQQAN
ncbi:MAG TPA: DUF6443 domain-containing protein [Hymenobacter sp.]